MAQTYKTWLFGYINRVFTIDTITGSPWQKEFKIAGVRSTYYV